MTAPVDPVGALARLLIDTSDQFHREMSAWREGGEIINWGNVWLAMARAALAHARELVPEARSYGGPTDATPDVYRRLQRLPRRDAAAAGRGGDITWEERS